eukprot:1079573-Pelagomonas_calceolata.AAC.3
MHVQTHLVDEHHVVSVDRHRQADDHGVAAFVYEDGVCLIYNGKVQVLGEDLHSGQSSKGRILGWQPRLSQ